MSEPQSSPVVLITGSARRIGAVIAETLHQAGMRIVLHYSQSANAAEALRDKFNTARPDSAVCLAADLSDHDQLESLIQHASEPWGQLNVLINNASRFYPTPFGSVTEAQWQDLLGSNLHAPFFLAQAAVNADNGLNCIINITDVHATQPLKNYAAYSIAKAGLNLLTKALASELSPTVRVNAIAPGNILWPTDEKNALTEKQKTTLTEKILLQRTGTPQDIANTARFLINDAPYITGQVITVDGGKSVTTHEK